MTTALLDKLAVRPKDALSPPLTTCVLPGFHAPKRTITLPIHAHLRSPPQLFKHRRREPVNKRRQLVVIVKAKEKDKEKMEKEKEKETETETETEKVIQSGCLDVD